MPLLQFWRVALLKRRASRRGEDQVIDSEHLLVQTRARHPSPLVQDSGGLVPQTKPRNTAHGSSQQPSFRGGRPPGRVPFTSSPVAPFQEDHGQVEGDQGRLQADALPDESLPDLPESPRSSSSRRPPMPSRSRLASSRKSPRRWSGRGEPSSEDKIGIQPACPDFEPAKTDSRGLEETSSAPDWNLEDSRRLRGLRIGIWRTRDDFERSRLESGGLEKTSGGSGLESGGLEMTSSAPDWNSVDPMSIRLQ
jgi:hypothetical protein